MLRALTFLAALAATTTACQNKVGNACLTNLDCGLEGKLTCDVSNLVNALEKEGGECVVENCSFGSCDKGSICIKVYGTGVGSSRACNPDSEDQLDPTGMMTNDCYANEVCSAEGICVDELRARTSCRLECDKDEGEDCRREGYRCKPTGQGFYVAPDPNDPTRKNDASICVPEATKPSAVPPSSP